MSVVGRSVCCFLGEEPLGGIAEEEEEEEGGGRGKLREGFGVKREEEEEEMEWGVEEVGRWREEVERSGCLN